MSLAQQRVLTVCTSSDALPSLLLIPRITFSRGKQLAEQNQIADVLYPLFEQNIQSFLYHPDNYPRTAAVMAAAQERHAQRQRAPGNNSPNGQASGGAPPLLRANTTPNGAPLRDQDEGAMPAPGASSWGHPPSSTTQHHNSGAYGNTSSPTQLHSQQNGQAQQGQGVAQQGSAVPGYPLRPAPADRRHSMPLTLANLHNHPGHAENPYGAPQPGPVAPPPGPRRTASGLKRSYDEHGDADGLAPPAPTPSMSYGTNGGVNMSASNSAGSVGYDGESPRVYKRARDSRGGEDSNLNDYSNDSDVSRSSRPLGEYDGRGASACSHAAETCARSTAR